MNEFINEDATFNSLEITTDFKQLEIYIHHDEGSVSFPLKPSDFDRFVKELHKAKEKLQAPKEL